MIRFKARRTTTGIEIMWVRVGSITSKNLASFNDHVKDLVKNKADYYLKNETLYFEREITL